jgi:hypothetical protein
MEAFVWPKKAKELVQHFQMQCFLRTTFYQQKLLNVMLQLHLLLYLSHLYTIAIFVLAIALSLLNFSKHL